jgi:hypothetical protein
MEQAEKIRLILEDIQHSRQEKIRLGLCRIAKDVQTGGSAYAVQLNHVAAMEINSVRQFMTGVRHSVISLLCHDASKYVCLVFAEVLWIKHPHQQRR